MLYQRIKYFLTAAQAGSFVKAAEQMYISSQALTKQVHLFEKEIGGSLFHRTSKGIYLTPLGETAYRLLQPLDKEMDVALSTLRQHAHNSRPQLNIGVFASLPRDTITTPVISFLLGSFHDYQINLNMVELNEGKQLILNGTLDLLFTNYHEEDDFSGCDCFYMEKHSTKAIVSLYHPWALKERITTQDMQQETFIKMEMDHGHYKIPYAKSFYNTIPCREMKTVNNFNTLFALLQQGDGFAIFPKAYAYMEQAKMKYFDLPDRTFYFYTGLIYNASKSRNMYDNIVHDIVDEFNMHHLT